MKKEYYLGWMSFYEKWSMFLAATLFTQIGFWFNVFVQEKEISIYGCFFGILSITLNLGVFCIFIMNFKDCADELKNLGKQNEC